MFYREPNFNDISLYFGPFYVFPVNTFHLVDVMRDHVQLILCYSY
jgi:hypothetical protein